MVTVSKIDCLNPECDNEVWAGVCVACANSDYDPCADGLDVPDEALPSLL